MSSKAAAAVPGADAPAKKGGKKKLLILAVPAVLAAAGAGLWFGGILPPLLGMGEKPAHAASEHGGSEHGAGEHGAGEHGAGEHKAEGAAEKEGRKEPVFMDLPDIVANLNTGGRRNVFIKLHAKLEISKADDRAVLTAAMPRLLDLFQTYLREMRPEEMRGAGGTYRLREELIARANIAATPARVVDVLFTEMLIQ